jgi:hypothetical protein
MCFLVIAMPLCDLTIYYPVLSGQLRNSGCFQDLTIAQACLPALWVGVILTKFNAEFNRKIILIHAGPSRGLLTESRFG